jgi:hypothetical protein
MSTLYDTVDELRRMSESELTKVAEDGLLSRLKDQAAETTARHGVLGPGNLDAYLSDTVVLRHPTRLVLEYGEMGMHQFAQPGPDPRKPGGIVLYLRPSLGSRPDMVAVAVSYMIPVINYGDIIEDRHCVEYGSVVTGLEVNEYFTKICEIADFVGAEEMEPASAVDLRGEKVPCGTGCGCG